MKYKHQFKWILLLICALLYSITGASTVMYIPIALQLCRVFWKTTFNEILDLLLFSIIVPDNYLIILTSVLAFILFINKLCAKKQVVFCATVVVSYAIIVSLINNVPALNLIIYIVYIIPFFLLGHTLKKMTCGNKIDIEQLYLSLKKILIVEGISILVYAISHFSTVLTYKDMDWVTGTFGKYQCNVLMIYCCFNFIIFVDRYLRTKKTDIIPIALSAIILVSTSSVAYMIIFFMTFGLVLLLTSKMSAKSKMGIIILGCFSVFFLKTVTPQWIIDEFGKMLDVNYAFSRIGKIVFYRNTYFEIPKNEGVFKFLFGGGLGQYASRAAVTCAGNYVGLYDSYFEPYTSELFQKYILAYSRGLEGLADSPQAAFISLQGELGIIGVITTIVYFAKKMLRAKNAMAIECVLFFLGLMTVENVLEFAKICLAFWLAYYLCLRNDIKGELS